MLKTLIMDEVAYTFAFNVERRSVVLSGDNSGMLMNGTYYNDVIATYLEYDITIAVPAEREQEYSDFYEALTTPVAYHDFVLPYNNSDTLVRGRVESVPDVYLQKVQRNGIDFVTWKEIKFTIIESVSRKHSDGTYTPVESPSMYITSKYSEGETLNISVITFANPSLVQKIADKTYIEAKENADGELIIEIENDHDEYDGISFSSINEQLIVNFD